MGILAFFSFSESFSSCSGTRFSNFNVQFLLVMTEFLNVEKKFGTKCTYLKKNSEFINRMLI